MMKRLGLVLFMVCLCLVLFQKSELEAFFRDDVDPKKAAKMIKEEREQSSFRLEKLRLEKKLKADMEQDTAAPVEITRENRQETVVDPSSALPDLKQTEKKTSIKKIINLISIVLIVISVMVYIIFLRKEKQLPV